MQGVLLQDETFIPCEIVVSSIGYHHTFQKLIKDDICKQFSMPTQLPVKQSHGFTMINVSNDLMEIFFIPPPPPQTLKKTQKRGGFWIF